MIVLRVFHYFAAVPKPAFRAGHGPWIRWPAHGVARAGHVEGCTLVLREDLAPDPAALARATVVVLNEWVPNHLADPGPPSWLAVSDLAVEPLQPTPAAPAPYEIFSLRVADEGLALHLDAARHAGWLGEPRRADMRLALLRPGAPVRVSLNGKHDHRAQRMYAHAGYLLEHLGVCSAVALRPAGSVGGEVPLLADAARHVDLLAWLH